MKAILLACVFLASGSAFASTQKQKRVPSSVKFEDDCDDMRKTIVVFSQNIQVMDSNFMKLLDQAGKKVDDAETTALNGAMRGLSGAIDELSAKIDKSCN